MQFWIHLQVWVVLFLTPTERFWTSAQTEKSFHYALERRQALLQFYSLLSVLLHFIFFNSFHVYIHPLPLSEFSLCLPQTSPGKPLPPMMFPWWILRSGAKLSSLAGTLLCVWPCTMLWRFGVGRTVQCSADAEGFSCLDSRRAVLIYINWKLAFTMLSPPTISMLVHQLRV